MKKNNLLTILIFMIIFCSFQMTNAQEPIKLTQDSAVLKKIESSLNMLKKALNEHNFGLVEDHFDEDFSYGDFGCGGGCSSASSIMGMVVSSYPLKVKDIKIKKITRTGPDIQLLTSFHFEDKDEADQEILMTQDIKFLEMELPGIKLMLGGQESDTSGG